MRQVVIKVAVNCSIGPLGTEWEERGLNFTKVQLGEMLSKSLKRMQAIIEHLDGVE